MFERKKPMLDEFYPPSNILGFPPEKKNAWTEETLPNENTRCFYQYFRRFAIVYKYLGSFPVQLTNSSTNLKFSYSSILTVTSTFLPTVLNFTLQVFYPQHDTLDQFLSLAFNLVPLLDKLLFFARFPSLIKLIQLMDEIDGSSCLEKPDPNVPKKNHRFVHFFGLCFFIFIIFPHALLKFGFLLIPELIDNYVSYFITYYILLTQMVFLYVICYQMCYFFDRFHAKFENLVELVCEEVREIDYVIIRATKIFQVSCPLKPVKCQT